MPVTSLVAAFSTTALLWQSALADVGSDEHIDLYFGVGCFWHIQYEIVKAEREILSRTDGELTALCGYAGGTSPNSAGGVCYPHYSSDGPLGHAEVVGLRIPMDKLQEFAEVYWSLFVGINRVDVMDVGPDYRAVLGYPGGLQRDEITRVFLDAQGAQKFELLEGLGADADTLGVARVWVMDSEKFPFYQAEVHHQFHDDFMPGGKYPQSYNDLRETFLMDCRLVPTPCRLDATFRTEWAHAQQLACPGLVAVSMSANDGEDADEVSVASSGSGGSGGGSGFLAEEPEKDNAGISQDGSDDASGDMTSLESNPEDAASFARASTSPRIPLTLCFLSAAILFLFTGQ